MANDVRGQVLLKAGEQTYKLQLSWNAIAVLKKQTGMGLKGVLAAFADQGDDPDPDLMSSVLWAAMQDHQPDVTIEEAAKVFPDGGLEEMVEKIQEMFAAAFPKSMKAADSNPPKAATKTAK